MSTMVPRTFWRPARTGLAGAITGALLAALAPVAAHAQAGTLTFQNTGDNGVVTPIVSGPALTIAGSLRAGFGNAATLDGELRHWSSNYSGGAAVFGNRNQQGVVAELALSGTAGESLALTSARFGTYSDRASFIRVRVFDASFTSLFDQVIATLTQPQTIAAIGATTTSGTLRLQWTETTADGTAAGRGVFDAGVGQIDFRVSPADGTVVPEPATVALLAPGLLAVGLLRRRRAAR